MALQNEQVLVSGVLGGARIPGALGAGTHTGQSADFRGTTKWLPCPLRISPSTQSKGSTVTKIAPKMLKMPTPANGSGTLRLHVVNWDLGADSPSARNSPLSARTHTPKPTDVIQGALANCPVASILAAMANTPSGRSKISTAVHEHVTDWLSDIFHDAPIFQGLSPKVVTDLSAVMKYLDDDPDWKDKPNGSLRSNRFFRVDLPGIKNQEVSDVFYTDDGDRNWQLTYIGFQGIRRDRGIKPVLWPSVIEKAYAAQLNGYEKLDALDDPVVAWQALVGPAPKQLQVENLSDSEITRRVHSANQLPTIATTRDDRADATSLSTESGGLIEGWHGYAVLGMVGNQIALYDPHDKSLTLSLGQFRRFFTTIFFGGL